MAVCANNELDAVVTAVVVRVDWLNSDDEAGAAVSAGFPKMAEAGMVAVVVVVAVAAAGGSGLPKMADDDMVVVATDADGGSGLPKMADVGIVAVVVVAGAADGGSDLPKMAEEVRVVAAVVVTAGLPNMAAVVTTLAEGGSGFPNRAEVGIDAAAVVTATMILAGDGSVLPKIAEVGIVAAGVVEVVDTADGRSDLPKMAEADMEAVSEDVAAGFPNTAEARASPKTGLAVEVWPNTGAGAAVVVTVDAI